MLPIPKSTLAQRRDERLSDGWIAVLGHEHSLLLPWVVGRRDVGAGAACQRHVRHAVPALVGGEGDVDDRPSAVEDDRRVRVHIDQTLCRNGGGRTIAETSTCSFWIHAVDAMGQARIELGGIAQQLEQQGVLRRARAAALGEHALRRLVLVTRVRDRPDAFDDRDELASRQRLASGSNRNARS